MGFRLDAPAVIKQTDITGTALLATSRRRTGPNLLEKVAELGSLRDAANSLGLAEELAWHYLVAANNLAEHPLIQALTPDPVPTYHARRLLGHADDLAVAFERFLDTPGGGAFRQFQQRHQFLRRLAARTSARNQFYCRIHAVRRERVNAVVTLDLGGGDRLAAHITARSAEELGLVAGRACHALVEPGWVEVRPELPAASIQNCLRGRIVRIEDDPVDSEVAIELAGGRIVLATLSRAEIADKELRRGQTVHALIQASQIILAVDAPPTADLRGETP